LNFNKLCGIAIARFGLNTREFYELSPAEFFEALNDHREREQGTLEILTRTAWESAREIIFYGVITNPNIKKKFKHSGELFKFSWEMEGRDDETEEIKIERMKKVLQGMHIKNQKRLGKNVEREEFPGLPAL